ncbi:hypothetical protein C8Q70DRAFT_1057209 [Cubamyces menziesii]|nr:hypothetical protein C8Q70DRAFT_1057209 [Cubamyces menziesii]
MLFNTKFRALTTVACVLLALVGAATADPAPMAQRARADSPSVDANDAANSVHTVIYPTRAELQQWLSTIDPSLLTYTGAEDTDTATPDPAADTTVVYCAKRSGNSCQATCPRQRNL